MWYDLFRVFKSSPLDNTQHTSSVWVFIAQLVEDFSVNAEATGSNPVEAPKNFFSGYLAIA